MTPNWLALVWMHPERDIACLTLLAGLSGFLFTRIFKSRSMGTVVGFVTAEFLALSLGMLHFFSEGSRSVWLIPGLVIPILAAFAGSVLVRVPASASPKAS